MVDRMCIYAGIDEAGYGPMFGPLVIGRTIFGIDLKHAGADANQTPQLWELLSKAVCRELNDRRGRTPRIAVNDSKKLRTAAAGIKHLELGVLAFVGLVGHRPELVDHWLDCLGEQRHRDLSKLPWYQPDEHRPWAKLPRCTTAGEVAIARSVLTSAAEQAGVQLLDMGAAVVYEDQFNQMLAATRSKASVNFTFVASHLRTIWDRFGQQGPTVVVDRQSGRVHYRELLAMTFPDASLRILEEQLQMSSYLLTETSRPARAGGLSVGGGHAGSSEGSKQTGGRSMTVRFEVEADGAHMPTALASMVCKYTRELLMERFNNWFTAHLPQVKPTAGYALDAKRFWRQVEPCLTGLQIQPEMLQRMS